MVVWSRVTSRIRGFENGDQIFGPFKIRNIHDLHSMAEQYLNIRNERSLDEAITLKCYGHFFPYFHISRIKMNCEEKSLVHNVTDTKCF